MKYLAAGRGVRLPGHGAAGPAGDRTGARGRPAGPARAGDASEFRWDPTRESWTRRRSTASTWWSTSAGSASSAPVDDAAAGGDPVLPGRHHLDPGARRWPAGRAGRSAPVLIQAERHRLVRRPSGGPLPATEESPAAADFLAQVVRAAGRRRPSRPSTPASGWCSCGPARCSTAAAAPFLPMRLAWSVGLGATLGDGTQRMPMISLRGLPRRGPLGGDDRARPGPVQPDDPRAGTNAEFTDALARALRPAVLLARADGDAADRPRRAGRAAAR